ncbi:MAG: spore coat associated protein CotJA [Lachnospiraceae bacterium]|nr:spore coat associated protein CotJA [Lachnospiraceae bacterium]
MDTNRSRRDAVRYQQPCRNSCSLEKMDQYVVAMAYVPWQKFGETLDPAKGMRIGTIFPEMNRPFMRGGCRKS